MGRVLRAARASRVVSPGEGDGRAWPVVGLATCGGAISSPPPTLRTRAVASSPSPCSPPCPSSASLRPADIYLIEEPSAYLDSEQRIVALKVIKRFILHLKETALIMEHAAIMAAYLADKEHDFRRVHRLYAAISGVWDDVLIISITGCSLAHRRVPLCCCRRPN